MTFGFKIFSFQGGFRRRHPGDVLSVNASQTLRGLATKFPGNENHLLDILSQMPRMYGLFTYMNGEKWPHSSGNVGNISYMEHLGFG